MIAKALISIIVCLSICVLFYLNVPNKKSINHKLLILSFLLGGICSYLSYRLEWHFGSYFKEMEDMHLLEVFIYAIFGVAIFEEGLKFLVSFLSIKLNKVKEFSSILLYTTTTSIGFANIENILFYFPNSNIDGIISRLITSLPSHICFAVFMAYIISKINKKNKYYIIPLSIIIPMILHAIYNTFLYQGIIELYKYTLIYLLVLVILSVYIIIKNKRRNT